MYPFYCFSPNLCAVIRARDRSLAIGNPYFIPQFAGVDLEGRLQRASSLKSLGIVTPPNPFGDQCWSGLAFDLDADIPDGRALIGSIFGIILQGEMRPNLGAYLYR